MACEPFAVRMCHFAGDMVSGFAAARRYTNSIHAPYRELSGAPSGWDGNELAHQTYAETQEQSRSAARTSDISGEAGEAALVSRRHSASEAWRSRLLDKWRQSTIVRGASPA